MVSEYLLVFIFTVDDPEQPAAPAADCCQSDSITSLQQKMDTLLSIQLQHGSQLAKILNEERDMTG